MREISKKLALSIAVFSVTVKCTAPSYELNGVVGMVGGVPAGVTVTLKGTGISTLTDAKGKFSLKIPYSVTPGVSVNIKHFKWPVSH